MATQPTSTTAVIVVSYDGVRSLYCGVGTMTLAATETIAALATESVAIGPLHLITTARSPTALGYSFRVEALSEACAGSTGGKVHTLEGTYAATNQWGGPAEWAASTPELVELIRTLAKPYQRAIVFAHDAPFLRAAALLAAECTNVAAYAIVHGPGRLHGYGHDAEIRHRWEIEALHLSDRLGVIAVSEYMQSLLSTDYGIPTQRIRLVRNGAWASALDAGPTDDIGLPVPSRLVLAYGRSEPYKGLDVLSSALSSMAWRSDWAALIVASPDTSVAPEADRLAAFDLGPGRRVLPRRLSRVTLRDLVTSQETVLVCPSLVEPFGLSLAEGRYWGSKGMGCVVVAANVGGLSEQIQDGVDGFLFEAGKREALVAALDKALNLSCDEFRRLAERGAATLADRYWYPESLRSFFETVP